MVDYSLIAEPPLVGFEKTYDNNTLRAPFGLAIVALSVPLGGEGAAQTALKKAYGVDMPAPGQSVLNKDGMRLLRTAPDQALAMFAHEAPNAEAGMAKALGDALYLTDQTDALVALELEGPQARAALARICPLDLHPDAFSQGAGARTMMEHLSVTIIRTGEQRYLLLSASSSAHSFLHAVETSLQNVVQ